jgi:ribonuclease T2
MANTGSAIRAFHRLIAVALLMLLAPTVQARQHAHAGMPGDFDFYLLSLSVAPSFCALSPANAAKDECRALTTAAFRQTPLTVHGLWPNRIGVSVNRQPQDCAAPSLDVGALPADVVAGLRRYMPAGPGLARYEWRKHGSCSGLTAADYFATVVQLARAADASIGGVLRAHDAFGRPLRIGDLLAGVAATDPALAAAIVVDCRTPRGGGRPLVDEIRVVLSKDFKPMPARTVGFGQNSGCPSGAGLLPDAAR